MGLELFFYNSTFQLRLTLLTSAPSFAAFATRLAYLDQLWIASYVVNRTQFVRVGQEQSSRTDCDCGVPQGSVLGPSLFTLYTSPVGSVISSFGIAHTLYTDDMQLYVALKDGSLSTLTECIKALHHWLTSMDCA